VEGLALPADQTVEPKDGFVVIAADTKADEVKWIVVGTVPVKYSPMGKTLILGTPAGAVIHVYAYAAVGGKATDPARTVVTVKGAPDAPRPPPDGPKPPDVTPKPPVASGPLHVVLVEDPLARAKFPHVGTLINDRALRDSIEKAGHKWRALDVRDPEVGRARLGPHIEAAGGTPALLVIGKDGTVHAAVPLPRTAAGVVEAINKAAAAKGDAKGS
jgi:hypothetical protein